MKQLFFISQLFEHYVIGEGEKGASLDVSATGLWCQTEDVTNDVCEKTSKRIQEILLYCNNSFF